MKLEIDWLKTNYTKLHYFGLGFIQLKLDHTHRLHFYTNKLPVIISKEEIHNHRYNFCSQIIRGSLKQELFQITQNNTHTIEDESCQEGIKPEKHFSLPCGILLTSKHRYCEGSEYWIDHEVFHRVESDDCITYLTLSDYLKKSAKVVRPANTQKVCPFSKKVDEKDLWEIIANMIVPKMAQGNI